MNCPKCHTQNVFDAKFCSNCGSALNAHTQEKDNGSIFILIWVVIWGMSNIIAQILLKSMVWVGLGFETIKYFLYPMWMIANLSLILIPFSVKNKPIKIAAFVIVGLISLYYFGCNVIDMLRAI